MADEDEEVVEEPSSGKAKKGKGGGFALSDKMVKMLLVVVGIVLLTVFVVVISVVTVRVVQKGTTGGIVVGQTEVLSQVPPQLAYFDLIPEIRTATNDVEPGTVVVNLRLGYPPEDKELQTELTAVYPRLTDMIRSFFSSKSRVELRPQNERILKEELLLRVNQLLTGKIEEIIFLDFQVIGL